MHQVISINPVRVDTTYNAERNPKSTLIKISSYNQLICFTKHIFDRLEGLKFTYCDGHTDGHNDGELNHFIPHCILGRCKKNQYHYKFNYLKDNVE